MNATIPPHVLMLAQALAGMLPASADEPSFTVESSRYVTIPLASAKTGFTVKAIERKKETGVWAEGDLWVKAPDGTVLIDMEGYEKWVAKAPGLRSGRRASASSSSGTAKRSASA